RLWIRTIEGVSQQIYSLPPLATWVTYHDAKTGRQRLEKKAPFASQTTANGGLFRSQQPPPICSLPLPFCKNQNSAVHEQRPWPSKKAAAIGSQRLARIINQIKPVGGGIQIARPCPDRPGQKSKVPEQHRAPVQ